MDQFRQGAPGALPPVPKALFLEEIERAGPSNSLGRNVSSTSSNQTIYGSPEAKYKVIICSIPTTFDGQSSKLNGDLNHHPSVGRSCSQANNNLSLLRI